MMIGHNSRNSTFHRFTTIVKVVLSIESTAHHRSNLNGGILIPPVRPNVARIQKHLFTCCGGAPNFLGNGSLYSILGILPEYLVPDPINVPITRLFLKKYKIQLTLLEIEMYIPTKGIPSNHL